MKQFQKLQDIGITGIEVTIDWLSVTVSTGEHNKFWEAVHVIPHIVNNERYKIVGASNGYRLAVQYECGVKVMINLDRPDMGVHVIMTGKTIAQIYDRYGLTGFDLIQWYKGDHIHFSRIDIALDAYNFGVDAIHYNNLYVDGKCTNKRSKCTFIRSNSDDGDTLYIGSLKSRRKLLRIYDKDKETGEHKDWLRFELQLSAGYGNTFASHLSDKIVENRKLAKAVIRGWCDFTDDPTYNSIFSEDALVLHVEEKGDTQTEKWLLTIVAKSLAKVSSQNPTFIGKFMAVYRNFLKSEDAKSK